MIKLSNGHEFEYIAASGTLGYNGKGWPHEWSLRWMGLIDPSLFTIVAKTVTFEPRKGNFKLWCPWRCIRLLPGGVINAVGLTNKGVRWWCEEVGVSVDSEKISLAGSILSNNICELAEMAQMLNDFDLVAVELNWSCPNNGTDLASNTANIIAGCEKVKEVSRFSLIAKLSVVHNIREIVPRIKGVVEAISINSVPWNVIFPNPDNDPEKESPLAHLGGGGVSGKIAQGHTWQLVKELADITSIPVIGPSIWEYGDIEAVRKKGAQAVSFGSVFLQHPCRPTRFVKRDMKENRNRN
ncbi:hypothetical protein KKC65_01180 [Patescibacteria group bacterium]|nr:hypothetical protein [Patescibacteria group bacterium]